MASRNKKIVPDSAWSWVVAVGCGWNLMWLSIVRRSGAIVFVALVSEYGATREQATWVISVSFSVACLFGPVVGILAKFFSTKAISLVGSLVLSITTILCFTVNDILSFFILLGIFNGIGTGVALVINDIVINQYFKKYRASGAGINYSGGTLAAFAFPPLFQMLIDYYGSKGAFLISGGLCLNSLAGPLLYRDPPRNKVAPVQAPIIDNIQPSKDGTGDNGVHQGGAVLEPTGNNECSGDRKIAWIDDPQEAAQAPVRQEGSKRDETTANNLGSVFKRKICDVQPENSSAHFYRIDEHDTEETLLDHSKLQEENGKVQTDDIHSTSSAKKDRNCARVFSKCATHFAFMKYPAFYLVTIGAVCCTYCLLVLVVLVDFAEEKGFTRQDGAVMLSVTAVGDACARLLSGIVSDKECLDRRTVMCASSLLTGSICIVFPLVYSFPWLLALCAVFGWSNGCVVVLFGPIMADSVGLQNLGMAMGMCRFAMGVAYFGCPKLAGHFKDNVGSYNGLFYFIGTCCLFVAVLWLSEIVRRKIKQRAGRSISAGNAVMT
ncbi:monocarboxylate transporter 5-like [Ornithodoros turicata]|uniref:monocarboxylate transporter 5-like n=1 Tax=Ornithodoros turicata TaxID=34597 RepID=UPI003138D93D